MRKKKRIFSLVLVMAMVLSSLTIQAQTTSSDGRFDDVPEDHWAYDEVKIMSDLGIIGGYGDGNFGPDDPVTREQFAKMLVLTLGKDKAYPSVPTFTDVDESDWSYPYVEAATSYLTGYIKGDVYYYYPKSYAQREDMAVAIVLGLGLEATTDYSSLEQFADSGDISDNLKKYVAKAVEEEIMIGDGDSFNPASSLKRAEAAVLLSRLIVSEKYGDKVVMNEVDETDKVVISDNSRTPVLEITADGDELYFDWSEVDGSNFKYYKVVASKYDSTPTYQSNGYMKAISNVNTTKHTVGAYDSVNSGDISKLMPGESYYFTITAVYNDGDKYYTSNVIYKQVPEIVEEEVPSASGLTPTLSYEYEDGAVELDWSSTQSDGFVYYKVVFSENDAAPKYPEDGYLKYISDVYDSDYTAYQGMSHNGGDVSKLVSGEDYYVSITAVYKFNNQKYYYYSNTVEVTVP